MSGRDRACPPWSSGFDVDGLLDSRLEPGRPRFLAHRFPATIRSHVFTTMPGVSHLFIGLASASDTRGRRRLYEHAGELVGDVQRDTVVAVSARVLRRVES